MNLKRLLLFGLIITTGLLNAQTDFRPGYIIKTEGDTLYGNLDYRGDVLMSTICKFISVDNQMYDYLPVDILAYRFNNSKYYVSKIVNDESIFLEYLLKGIVSIYYMRDDAGDHYFLEKEGEPLIELPYEEGIRIVANKQVYYESKKHIEILNYYMMDAPELQSRISTFNKPVSSNLIKLAEDYHYAVCEGEECIIYREKEPFTKLNIELVGGLINYNGIDNLNERFYFQGGIIGHFWIPRANEKLYIRTGILFSQLEFTDGEVKYFKIPLHLEYLYPKGVLRPVVSYGINFYHPYHNTVSLNLGTNVRLNHSTYLSVKSDIEFDPKYMLFPSNFLSYSFHIGLYFESK